MAIQTFTSAASLNATAAVTASDFQIQLSSTRLASGNRMATAGDDPSGVAILSRLSSEITVVSQAISNANDAQALINTTEGAHKELEDILQRMREISVQSSNGTNNAEDRINLQAEMDALVTEIDRIAHVTSWAGETLMDGNSGVNSIRTFAFEVGLKDQDRISVTVGSMTSESLGLTDSSGRFLTLTTSDEDRTTTTHHRNGGGTTAEANNLETIDLIDAAIQKVNTQRATLGATSNRLSFTVNNLTSTSTNLSLAKGTINDADYAAETTNLAKNQILQQASIAMMAQANADYSKVLTLLRQ
jgi:flagellin